MDFSTWIRESREARGWDLKRMSYYSGLNASTISRIETGTISLTLEAALLIREAFELSYSDFYHAVTGKTEPVKIPTANDKSGGTSAAPNVYDVVTFDDLYRQEPEVILTLIAGWLNEIYTARAAGSPPEVKAFTAETARILLNYSPIHDFSLQYPSKLDTNQILNIYRKGGVITPQDAHLYIDGKLTENNLLRHEVSTRFAIRVVPAPSSTMTRTKLQDLVELDRLIDDNGETLFMCIRAMEFEFLIVPRENRFPTATDLSPEAFQGRAQSRNRQWGQNFVLVNRWQTHLNLTKPHWQEEVMSLRVSVR